MSGQVLIRPDPAAAGFYYGQRRVDELLRQRAQNRADELDRLERKLDVIDLELAYTRRLAWQELAADLASAGFDVAGQPEPPLPLERSARRRGRPDHADPRAMAAAEEAASRGRLVRTFTPRITIR